MANDRKRQSIGEPPPPPVSGAGSSTGPSGRRKPWTAPRLKEIDRSDVGTSNLFSFQDGVTCFVPSKADADGISE